MFVTNFVCVLENESEEKKSNASVVASRLMPPNIPGARKGVRPPKGSRKSSARAHKFPSKGKSRGNNADGDGGSSGVGLFAALAAAVVAVVTITLRTNAEYNARNKSIRDRLRSKPERGREQAGPPAVRRPAPVKSSGARPRRSKVKIAQLPLERTPARVLVPPRRGEAAPTLAELAQSCEQGA